MTVEPTVFRPGFAKRFEKSLLLFYTGVTRSASDILRRQSAILAVEDDKISAVRRMVALTEDFRQAIQEENLEWIGGILNRGWELKRSITTDISNSIIDDLYSRARAAGGLGGKLLGAGGRWGPCGLCTRGAAGRDPRSSSGLSMPIGPLRLDREFDRPVLARRVRLIPTSRRCRFALP